MSLPAVIFSAVLLLWLRAHTARASCLGCVDLDEVTFDKITAQFPVALIKFDIPYPYGDKHEQFAVFAREQNPLVQDLVIGTVGVKDYGDKENLSLLKRFRIPQTDLPAILLFTDREKKKWLRYPKDDPISGDALKNFVRAHTSLYIGLSGCIKEFDELAVEFMANFNRNEFSEVDKIMIEKAPKLLDALDEQQSKTGSIYLQIMQRIRNKGIPFLKDEHDRVHKLMDTKITAAKKVELSHRLNILNSFREGGNIPSFKTEL